MLKWLFKKRKPVAKAPDTIDIGGMEPGMDEYALKERAECIAGIMESGKSEAEATALADSWFIMEVSAQYGGREPKKQYVPRPVWDWDWAWRQMFDTREEAEAHVESKRGALLNADPES
ncbi:hypothetical protein SEA_PAULODIABOLI_59 [Microbacterium phage PauloDiaboli]|nr:hypothetical protein SEA_PAULODIABOLI_59 [Microbacterium phage PauloDiaboli]QWY83910.1 hypothetical protein SEA_A3WALLY_60 [Microbacterium phage A3Wally]